MSREKLLRIENAIARVARDRVPGDFLECGVALGGSAIILSTLMPPGRSFHGYDVFGMIPAPGAEDDAKTWARYDTIRSGQSKGIGGDLYYGYRDDLYDEVVRNFGRFDLAVDGRRIALHRGLFADTLAPSGPIAFAHVDCDWYDPVKLCLERIWPHLSPGGYVVLDDYEDYGGCRKATDEFVEAHPEAEVVARAPHFVLRR